MATEKSEKNPSSGSVPICINPIWPLYFKDFHIDFVVLLNLNRLLCTKGVGEVICCTFLSTKYPNTTGTSHT